MDEIREKMTFHTKQIYFLRELKQLKKMFIVQLKKSVCTGVSRMRLFFTMIFVIRQIIKQLFL